MVLYRLREDNVPVIPIFQLFNIPCEFDSIENSLLVVVEADGQKIGLMVDDLLAQQQVVIKSLNDNYQQVEGISGATILGDGSVAMILDVPGIISMALAKAQLVHKHGARVQSQATQSISEGVIS
jgi:two-component system chemotaxis sensor kinase CheA